MDFQALADSFDPMTCIMSVEVFPDGSYGNIRIVAGNQAYVSSIEDPSNMAFGEMLYNKFITDSPYERYIPKDLNFEYACYCAAVLKKPFHTYIHPDRYSFWVDMYMMPIAADSNNTFYFAYSQELTTDASSKRMSNIDSSVSTSVLETCIKLRDAHDFRYTMNEVISDIRNMCQAEMCCILLTDFKAGTCSVLCESTAPDINVPPMKDQVAEKKAEFFELASTWQDSIAGSTCLIIQNERDMQVLHERNPKWCDSLISIGVRSIVLFPLYYSNETLGYIWAINFDTESTLKIRAALESTSYFVASEIANYQLLERLKTLSSMDMLTSVRNRNAMNDRIDELINQQETARPDSLSVVYADLNGLKQVNDSDGHVAGDMLLKAAADIFGRVFGDGEIYRAGGDEFMAIVIGISESELESRMNRLREYSADGNVSFALGCCYDDTECDIRRAMSIADKLMYKDKQQYYEKFPERRRTI